MVFVWMGKLEINDKEEILACRLHRVRRGDALFEALVQKGNHGWS